MIPTRHRNPALRPSKGLLGLLLFSFCLLVSAVPAQDVESPVLDLSTFERIPVLYNGRKMPLDTYARQTLLQFSGRQNVEDLSASAWMAELLFEPEQASGYAVFLINHPEVAEAIEIQPRDDRRYSYTGLHQALPRLMEKARQADSIPEEQRSQVEKEILRVASNLLYYNGLLQSFSFARPHPDFQPRDPQAAERLQVEMDTDLSALDLALIIERIRPLVEAVAQKAPAEWSALEQDSFRLAGTLFEWVNRFQGAPFEMIPSHAHDREDWISPWMAMGAALGDPGVRGNLQQLQKLYQAYVDGDQQTFDEAAQAVRAFTEQRLPGDRELRVLNLEVSYNQLRLFFWSKFLYFLGFLLGFGTFISGRKTLGRLAWLFLLIALIPHTAGMIMRMVIMGRPPVTNLYATFVFVSWICVLLSLLLERAQRNGLGLMSAGFSGIALLMLSARFASESDTLGKVVAVLDSNFWLSTHVIAITTGYAGCMLAGVMGHIYLIQAIWRPADREGLRATQRALYGILGFGLIFSFLGTMLGGVWADQSWGRFWGWDPKENGALLIVLWTAILFHARMAGMIRDIGFAVGAVLGVIVVMFAWLGVNLLGVGLHSYGFTSGLARGLYIYTAAQIFLATALGVAAARRARRV